MDLRPSETLERMRSLLCRLEQAVDNARSRRAGNSAGPVGPILTNAAPPAEMPQARTPQARVNDAAPAPIPFPAVSPSGKPKARAKSLEEFDEAFKRLADRQAG